MTSRVGGISQWGPAVALTVSVLGCSSGQYVLEQAVPLTISVTSPLYEEDGRFPQNYTCYGEEISPPVEWSGVPDGAKSIAVIFEDLDVSTRIDRGSLGSWSHWVLFAIPPDATGIEEGASTGSLPSGVREGTNDDRHLGYSSPCVLQAADGVGSDFRAKTIPHRLVFSVYALDKTVDLEPGATKSELLQAIDGNILAGGRLMAKFAKSPEYVR